MLCGATSRLQGLSRSKQKRSIKANGFVRGIPKFAWRDLFPKSAAPSCSAVLSYIGCDLAFCQSFVVVCPRACIPNGSGWVWGLAGLVVWVGLGVAVFVAILAQVRNCFSSGRQAGSLFSRDCGSEANATGMELCRLHAAEFRAASQVLRLRLGWSGVWRRGRCGIGRSARLGLLGLWVRTQC